jgi:hypothetical protein
MQFNKYANRLRQEDPQFLKRTLETAHLGDIERETVKEYLQERCQHQSVGRGDLYAVLGGIMSIGSFGVGLYTFIPETLRDIIPERFEPATLPLFAGTAALAAAGMIYTHLKSKAIRKRFSLHRMEAKEIRITKELASIGINQPRKAA